MLRARKCILFQRIFGITISKLYFDVESLALSDWGSADLDTLLGNVENEIPQNDTSKYSTALEKISWENVKFGCHSAEDCKQATHRLINQVNTYFTLNLKL